MPSDSDSTVIPVTVARGDQGLPLTYSNVQALNLAMAGGEATANYFQNLVLVNNFLSWVNTTPGAWIETTDSSNNPAWFATQGSGANSMSMIMTAVPDSGVLSGTTTPINFPWNGVNYNIVGSLQGTLTFADTPAWYVTLPIAVAEAVPTTYLGTLVWKGWVGPCLAGMINGVKTCFSQVAANVGIAGQAAAQGEAAAAATVEEAPVTATVEVTCAMAGVAFVAVAILAAIPIVLQAIAHESYHTVKIYNLTGYDVTWAQPYIYQGAMNAAPVMDSQDDFDYDIPAMSQGAPPGLQPVSVAHEADLSFVSASGYHGLGYILSLAITDPSNGHAPVGTGTVMFDVPWAADNSLYATFDTVSDYPALWSAQSGQSQNKVTQMVATLDTPGITVTATFDYLDGEHPTPSGQNAYTYNSVIVLAPVTQ